MARARRPECGPWFSLHLPGFAHGLRRPGDHHGGPVVSVPHVPGDCPCHAQHVDQRRNHEADARRPADHADPQLPDRGGQAHEQAAANRAAVGDLAAAAGGGARLRWRPLGLSAVRLRRDDDDGDLRRVLESVLLDLHPPGLHGDHCHHRDARRSVLAYADVRGDPVFHAHGLRARRTRVHASQPLWGDDVRDHLLIHARRALAGLLAAALRYHARSLAAIAPAGRGLRAPGRSAAGDGPNDGRPKT